MGEEKQFSSPDDVVAAALAERKDILRRRRYMTLAVSTTVTVVWLLYVTLAGQWVRVGNNWQATVTMVFGSFVAGSTPQGGGAVAFPVFTKLLEVPSEVARTFSLSVQAVGMGAASLTLMINRRTVEWRAIIIGGLTANLSFVVALFLLSDRSRPFWPAILPGPYIRVTFTLVLASMAFIVYLGTRVPIRKIDVSLPPMNARLYVALVVAGVLGGVFSALTGSGADVMLYLFIVVLFGVDPKVGVPSSVMVMASVSLMGLLVLGIGNGHLSVELADGTSGGVVAVAGDVVGMVETDDGRMVPAFTGDGDPLPARRFDLFGLWLAGIPIVAWGAPLGAWFASRMTARQLVIFAGSLAAVELVTTIIFLPALHGINALSIYAITGLASMLVGLYLLAKYRRLIFGLPGLSPEETLRRGSLDIKPGYERHLRDKR